MPTRPRRFLFNRRPVIAGNLPALPAPLFGDGGTTDPAAREALRRELSARALQAGDTSPAEGGIGEVLARVASGGLVGLERTRLNQADQRARDEATAQFGQLFGGAPVEGAATPAAGAGGPIAAAPAAGAATPGGPQVGPLLQVIRNPNTSPQDRSIAQSFLNRALQRPQRGITVTDPNTGRTVLIDPETGQERREVLPARPQVEVDAQGNRVTRQVSGERTFDIVPGSPAEREAIGQVRGIITRTQTAGAARTTANETVDNLISLIESETAINPVTGPLADAAANISGSAAATFRSQINALKSRVALDALQALRDAAPSGASGLGQVTGRELDLLEATLGSIDPRQSREELVRQLGLVRERLNTAGQLIDQNAQSQVAEFQGRGINIPQDLQERIAGLFPQDPETAVAAAPGAAEQPIAGPGDTVTAAPLAPPGGAPEAVAAAPPAAPPAGPPAAPPAAPAGVEGITANPVGGGAFQIITPQGPAGIIRGAASPEQAVNAFLGIERVRSGANPNVPSPDPAAATPEPVPAALPPANGDLPPDVAQPPVAEPGVEPSTFDRIISTLVSPVSAIGRGAAQGAQAIAADPSGAANVATNALALGFGPQLEELERSLFGASPEEAEAARAQFRQSVEGFTEENPGTALGLELGTGVAGGAGLVRAAPGLFRTATRAGATSGAIGAASAQSVETADEVSTALAGGLGFVGGFAGTRISQALSRAFQGRLNARAARLAPTAQQADDAATAAYRAFDDAGAAVTSRSYAQFLQRTADELAPTDPISTQSLPRIAALGQGLRDEAQRALQSGAPVPFSKVEATRKLMNRIFDNVPFDDDATRRTLQQFKERVDDYFATVPPSEVIAGNLQNAQTAIREARRLYTNARKGDTLTDLIAVAAEDANPEQALRNSTRQLLKDIAAGKEKRFTQAEVQILRDAARQGVLEQFGGVFQSVGEFTGRIGRAIAGTTRAATRSTGRAARGVRRGAAIARSGRAPVQSRIGPNVLTPVGPGSATVNPALVEALTRQQGLDAP